MKQHLLGGACAIALAATLGAIQISAQQPSGTSQQPSGTSTTPTTQAPSTTPTQSASDSSATTKLVGCLYREADIPGRTPNVAERAGVMEDYILADAQPADQAGTPTGTSGSPSATSGSTHAAGKMFKVEKIADEQLRSLVGKKVEVTGTVDADATKERSTGTTGAEAPKPDENPASPDAIELPEFEAVSIREVSGSCPPKPSSR